MIAAMSKTIDDKLAAHQKAVAKATDAKMKQMADHLSKDIATAAAAAPARVGRASEEAEGRKWVVAHRPAEVRAGRRRA